MKTKRGEEESNKKNSLKELFNKGPPEKEFIKQLGEYGGEKTKQRTQLIHHGAPSPRIN